MDRNVIYYNKVVAMSYNVLLCLANVTNKGLKKIYGGITVIFCGSEENGDLSL